MSAPAQLRRDRTAEIARLKTLSCKLRGIIASADECNDADRNGQIGNLAFDVETLAHEISMAGHRLYVTCDAIRLHEYEAAQREAEIEHGPLISDLKAMIDGTRVTYLRRPANNDSRYPERTA